MDLQVIKLVQHPFEAVAAPALARLAAATLVDDDDMAERQGGNAMNQRPTPLD